MYASTIMLDDHANSLGMRAAEEEGCLSTNPAPESFEVSLLGTPWLAMRVDLAGDSGLDTRRTPRHLPVAP